MANDSNERVNPATKILTPTFSDSQDVPTPELWRAIRYSGDAPADVAIIATDDDIARTIPAMQPGELLPISVRRVMATGTTAAAGSVTLLR